MDYDYNSLSEYEGFDIASSEYGREDDGYQDGYYDGEYECEYDCDDETTLYGLEEAEDYLSLQEYYEDLD